MSALTKGFYHSFWLLLHFCMCVTRGRIPPGLQTTPGCSLNFTKSLSISISLGSGLLRACVCARPRCLLLQYNQPEQAGTRGRLTDNTSSQARNNNAAPTHCATHTHMQSSCARGMHPHTATYCHFIERHPHLVGVYLCVCVVGGERQAFLPLGARCRQDIFC